MPFAIKPKQTVLFVGDSITDCGRRGPERPFGNGYVRQVIDLMIARYPAHQNTFINVGVGGNTVRDLMNRWTDDVIRAEADWVSIKIGINDIHRWLRNVTEQSVDPDEFAEMYELILTRLRDETDTSIVLVDPFYLSTDKSGQSFRSDVLKHLPKYLKTVEAMAAKFKTKHVRTHKAFATQLKHYPADRFCPEPVHPNLSGHLVIAHEWLKTMGW